MPRAVVVPALAEASRARRRRDDGGAAHYGAGRTGPQEPSPQPTGDDYAERLVKYVPGEALALFLPFSSIAGLEDAALLLLLAGTTVGTVLWSLNRNDDLAAGLRQSSWTVGVFAVVAFLAWALGTSAQVQDLVGASTTTCTVIMALVAALLPAVDERIARLRLARRGDSG